VVIDPTFWLKIANERQPRSASVTDWLPGHIAPAYVGIYERHFTDGNDIQHWDGDKWRVCHANGVRGPAHWRQVGDYPAWRGLNSPALVGSITNGNQ